LTREMRAQVLDGEGGGREKEEGAEGVDFAGGFMLIDGRSIVV
jgi:hypothetical protein